MKRRNWTSLYQPLRARKPAVWVMPDVFATLWEYPSLDKDFAVMASRPDQHFELHALNLDHLREYLSGHKLFHRINDAARTMTGRVVLPTQSHGMVDRPWPLRNLSIWATIHTQADADRDLPLLLSCPAAVRGLRVVATEAIEFSDVTRRSDAVAQLGKRALNGIHRVRITGDTSRNAAPCNVEWLCSIARQCEEAGLRPGVDVVVEALGRKPVDSSHKDIWCNGEHHYTRPAGHHIIAEALAIPSYSVTDQDLSRHIRSRTGSDPAEWPADLRRFAAKEDAE